MHRPVSCWLALDEVRPDQGPLEFYSASQKLGQLGGASTLFDYPRLLAECPLTEPDHLLLGDATAHMSGVVHGAAQTSAGIRVGDSFPPIFQRTLGTAAGRPVTPTGSALNSASRFDHPHFPIISEACASQRCSSGKPLAQRLLPKSYKSFRRHVSVLNFVRVLMGLEREPQP